MPLMWRRLVRFSVPLVTAALVVALVSAVLADSTQVTTRFGTLTLETLAGRVNFQGRVLYKGRPLHPDVRGNNALYVEQIFRLAGSDAVLFRDVGGDACPDLWYFVSVSPSGAASTPEFGSCGSLLGAMQKGQAIVVRTRGFLGPFEPQAARVSASKQTHEFIYHNDVVTENGKPIPCGSACN
jgi:hypothetical protein